MFIINAFREGGIFMFVILAFALFSLSFVIERYLALFVRHKNADKNFRSRILEYTSRGEYKGAEQYAVNSQTGLGNVVAVGLHIRSNGGGEEEIQARMDEQLTLEIEKIDKRTGFLAMFGNVATLVGLLGTIVGMIHSFSAVAAANPMDRATLLSKGIAEAMNCTAFGLIVAVPALVLYAIYQNKTDKIINGLTNSSTEIYHDLIFKMDQGVHKTVAAEKVNHSSLSH